MLKALNSEMRRIFFCNKLSLKTEFPKVKMHTFQHCISAHLHDVYFIQVHKMIFTVSVGQTAHEMTSLLLFANFRREWFDGEEAYGLHKCKNIQFFWGRKSPNTIQWKSSNTQNEPIGAQNRRSKLNQLSGNGRWRLKCAGRLQNTTNSMAC